MPKYLFIYHAEADFTPPATQEEGEAAMAAWGAWMGGIGPALVEAGEPVGKSVKVDATGARPEVENPAFGWSIVEAADMDAACKLAEGNPMIAGGGHVEVAEIMPIQM
jgi:hypothetical protein